LEVLLLHFSRQS